MPRIVDLTVPIEPHFRWPMERSLKSSFADGRQFQVTWLGLVVHGFTHIDSPRHMVPDGRTSSEVPLEATIGEAAIVDLSEVEPKQEIGAEPGMGKKILNAVTSVGRDLADVAVQSDYYRLIGDLLMSRQAEDTLKTFREAGRALGLDKLYRIGEVGERHHDDYNREAHRLIQQMFVEQVRGVELDQAARAEGSRQVADSFDRRPTI